MEMPRQNKFLFGLLIAAFTMVVLASDAMACPTCKEGISGADPVSVARATGYFYSILFMMSMPFVIVGTFGGLAYFSIRKAREQQNAKGELKPGDSLTTT